MICSLADSTVAMDADANDLFSVSSTSQSIDKRYSHTSLTWKIVFLQQRIKKDNTEIRSPVFQFVEKPWELRVILWKISNSSSYIKSIELICVNENSKYTDIIYTGQCSISDEKGNILHKNPSKTICMCENCSHNILWDGSNAVFVCLEQKISSLKISLNLFSEENTKQVVLASEVIIDETRDSLPIYESKLSSDFKELYESRQLSDVILKLGEQEFPAHKSVLSARSKVFAAMFEHDMKENRQGTVDLVQMEADTVQDMLRYIYCAKVRELSNTEALNLYVAADRYDLKELRSICRKVVARGISLSNVFDIAAVADIHDDELLIRELKSFMSKNGKDIINNDKWKEVFSLNLVLLAKMYEWSLSAL